MFENGEPDIVLKMVKSFHIKRTPIIILIQKKFKLGIFDPVMFNKMLVIIFIKDFYSEYGPGSQRMGKVFWN